MTVPPTIDGDLLSRMRAGDEEAFASLVREHTGRLLVVARRFLRNEEDAADAVQDAFISAFKALDRFSEQSSLATWLHRITVNASLMKLRKQSRRKTCSIDELLPQFDETGHHRQPIRPWPEKQSNPAADAETKAVVRDCIDRLPESYRTVVLLRDIEGMDTDRAATVLGVTRGVVKTRLHRARLALRTLLEPYMRDSVRA